MGAVGKHTVIEDLAQRVGHQQRVVTMKPSISSRQAMWPAPRRSWHPPSWRDLEAAVLGQSLRPAGRPPRHRAGQQLTRFLRARPASSSPVPPADHAIEIGAARINKSAATQWRCCRCPSHRSPSPCSPGARWPAPAREPHGQVALGRIHGWRLQIVTCRRSACHQTGVRFTEIVGDPGIDH